jgi:hypothetical protein
MTSTTANMNVAAAEQYQKNKINYSLEHLNWSLAGDWYRKTFQEWLIEKREAYRTLPPRMKMLATMDDYTEWLSNRDWFNNTFYEWIREKIEYEDEFYMEQLERYNEDNQDIRRESETYR